MGQDGAVKGAGGVSNGRTDLARRCIWHDISSDIFRAKGLVGMKIVKANVMPHVLFHDTFSDFFRSTLRD